ncbi:MAG: hypothetical protein ACTSUU_06920 [Candidatus Thorarchaeota archaeon]
MSKLMRQPFTPGGKFVTSKAFRFHGKSYTKGDEFPWRQLSCSVLKLRRLYEGRFLNNEYVNESEVEETGTMPEVEAAPSVEEETTLEDADEELTVYDPEIHEIINPDRGEWYLADAEGNRLLKLGAKEAKRLRKKHEPEEIQLDEE